MNYLLYLYTLYKKKINLIHETSFIYSHIYCLYFSKIKTIRTRTIFLYFYLSDNKTSRYLFFFYRIYRYKLYIKQNIKVKSLYPSLADNQHSVCFFAPEILSFYYSRNFSIDLTIKIWYFYIDIWSIMIEVSDILI